jgi:phage terminase small subunit
MPRGRPRKPSALAHLAGNTGKRGKLIRESGFIALGEPFIPEHLLDDARGCIEVIRQSMPPQIYSALDSFLLAAFGLAWAIHKKAALEISNPDFEWIEHGDNMNRPSPWLRIVNEQSRTMVHLATRLGLDPVSRDSLHAVASQQGSEFDGLLTGQRVTYSEEEA